MKFHMLQVLTLCICLGQMCFGSNNFTDDEIREDIRKQIYGVSEQFLDDFMAIREKYPNQPYITEIISKLVKLGRILKLKTSTIDVNQLRDFHATEPAISLTSELDIKKMSENLKVLQTIWSRQLPPERYNGIINLCFVFANGNATPEEIESALGYLYGTDIAATKTTFLKIDEYLNVNDCSDELQKYGVEKAEDMLKSIIDLKPKVILDFNAMREKFPCNTFNLDFLRSFAYVLNRLHGDQSKINACLIKENPGHWADGLGSYHNSREYLESTIQDAENILLTRLPDGTVRGMINFMNATIPDTPVDQIKKALEYLYDDVPNILCFVHINLNAIGN